MPGLPVSAIAALWRLGAPVAQGALEAMREALAPRPVESVLELPDRGLAVTATARLDDREALRRALGLDATASDARLILGAYERWGDRCPEHLLGDFAFVVADARGRLLCATDRFGLRPLYVHRASSLVAAASGIDALLALTQVPRRLNEPRLGDYLTTRLADPHETLYAGIERLPPAHALVVTAGGAALRRYWAPDPERPARPGTHADHVAAFRETFRTAVADRVGGSGDVGAMLSGGLDSSAIVVTAADLLAAEGAGRRVRAYAAVFDAAAESDERPWIASVAAASGVSVTEGRPEDGSPLADGPLAAWRFEEPLLNPQIGVNWALWRPAADAGDHVILDGLAGDDVVSHGHERLAELARQGRLRALGRELRDLSRVTGVKPRNALWRHVVAPLTPPAVRRRWSARPWLVPPGTVPLRAGFVRDAGLADRHAAQLAPPRFRGARADHADAVASGFYGLIAADVDRAAARCGVQPRFPFLDARLAELCVSLPADAKLRAGRTRAVAREALRGLLPDDVRLRPGKGRLGAAFVQSLTTSDRPLLDDLLLGGAPELDPYVDLAAMRERYRAAGDLADWLAVWRVALLALWLREARATGRLRS